MVAATRVDTARIHPVPTACAAVGLAGVAAALHPLLAVAATAAAVVLVVVWRHPPVAAYLLVVATPLTAGMDRGMVVPLLRPNEALLGLVAIPLLLRGARRLLAPDAVVALRPMDVLILVLVLTGSVLPALGMVARGVEVTQEDVLYATALWKYYGLFLVVRSSCSTDRHVLRCLWLSLAAGVCVAVVSILQSLDLFGVPALLASYYAPDDDVAMLAIGRGTSTLAQAQATGAVLSFNFAIAVGLAVRQRRHLPVLGVLGAVFLVGSIAAGQFSSFFGLLVAVGAIGLVTGQLGRLARGLVLVGPLVAAVVWPVVNRRLEGFDSPDGLPRSWVGRWENLQNYFWPELASDGGWIWGVRLAARLPGREPWQPWVYIESGHTWLLWIGGLPFLVGFFVFWLLGLRLLWRRARVRADAVGTAAAAAFAAMAAMGVLMVFDPHLTMRGSADLLFTLLALATVLPTAGPSPDRSHRSASPLGGDRAPPPPA